MTGRQEHFDEGSGKVPVERFGMTVHPESEWPIHSVSSQHTKGWVAPDREVHTTQAHVHGDQVNDMVAKGFKGVVTLAKHGDRLWVVDGHHALAAARAQGVNARAELHRTGRGDVVQPPKLRRKT